MPQFNQVNYVSSCDVFKKPHNKPKEKNYCNYFCHVYRQLF